MNLDKKVAGVKLKFLLAAAPVVIVAALYLRSRASSSTATDTTGLGTDSAANGADAFTDPTTGLPYSGAEAGSAGGLGGASGGATDTTPGLGTAIELDPAVQSEIDGIAGWIQQQQQSGAVGPGTAAVPAVPADTNTHPVAPTPKKTPVKAPAKSTPRGVSAMGAQAKRLAKLTTHTLTLHPTGAGSSRAAAGPHEQTTHAAPNHAAKKAPVKKPVAVKKPAPKPAPKKPVKKPAGKR